VTPFEVDHVINKAKQNYHANSQKTGVVLNEPILREFESKLLLDCHKQKYNRDDDTKCLWNWLLFLLDTRFVKISAEKSFFGQMVFKGINEFVTDHEGHK